MNIKFPIRVKEKLHNNPTTTNFFIYFNVHRKIHTYDRVLKNIELSWKIPESTYITWVNEWRKTPNISHPNGSNKDALTLQG